MPRRRGLALGLHAAQCAALVWVACVVLALDLPAPPWRWTTTTAAPPAGADVATEAAAGENGGEAAYGRLVVMLVDALREDFVHERPEMRFVRQLLREEPERTASFVSDANTPTVTMPRIKALTTGTVPRFIDVMNNLDSKALAEDNLVDRLVAAGRRLVMYGDETWLKLFPHQFARHDATSSFFTKDFTEVDDNVTRHLEEDFDPTMAHPASQNWDVAVLHYLGVDHIGHTLGPGSPQLGVKLAEMDRIFEQLHRSLRQQDRVRGARQSRDAATAPTLLVLLSDHGMNKVGNHGGASLPETSAFMLFAHVGASPPEFTDAEPKRRRHMAQVDLVPTLATLLDIGIPTRSVGRVLREPFASLPGGKQRYEAALAANAAQLLRLIAREAPHLDDAAMQEARGKDTEALVQHAHDAIYAARLGSSAGGDLERSAETFKLGAAVATMALVCLAGFAPRVPWRQLDGPSRALVAILALHSLSLTSSSAIENEHVVWNFFVLTWLLARAVGACRRSQGPQAASAATGGSDIDTAALAALALALLRGLRERLMVINFARLAGLDDQGDFVDEGTAVLVLPAAAHAAPVVASLLAGYGVGAVWRVQRMSATLGATARVCAVLLVVAAAGLLATLKVREMPREATVLGLDEVWRARAVYACAAGLAMLGLRSARTRHDGWELGLLGLETLLLLLHRKTATAILCASLVLTRVVGALQRRLHASATEVILLQWMLGQCIFFALGNSHVISTVDISGAYTGLSDYSQTLVGTLTFVITFSGPLLGVAHAARVLALDHADEAHIAQARVAVVVFQTCAAWRIAVATGVLVAMRSHLFIWSVFAPKWMLETMIFFFQALAGLVLVIPSYHQGRHHVN